MITKKDRTSSPSPIVTRNRYLLSILPFFDKARDPAQQDSRQRDPQGYQGGTTSIRGALDEVYGEAYDKDDDIRTSYSRLLVSLSHPDPLPSLVRRSPAGGDGSNLRDFLRHSRPSAWSAVRQTGSLLLFPAFLIEALISVILRVQLSVSPCRGICYHSPACNYLPQSNPILGSSIGIRISSSGLYS